MAPLPLQEALHKVVPPQEAPPQEVLLQVALRMAAPHKVVLQVVAPRMVALHRVVPQVAPRGVAHHSEHQVLEILNDDFSVEI